MNYNSGNFEAIKNNLSVLLYMMQINIWNKQFIIVRHLLKLSETSITKKISISYIITRKSCKHQSIWLN